MEIKANEGEKARNMKKNGEGFVNVYGMYSVKKKRLFFELKWVL